ncbi:hypothetical protein AB0436_13445 [Streptomyces sp. NPDC051322]|uniref:hypothetical protein n=1 Tax=Streptomyces sp. NPDC051322 TaxID=3154645 RepID=UPI00344CB8B6
MHRLFLPAVRRPRSLVAWFLLIAAAFALTQLFQVTGRATSDTRHYVSYSLMLSGQSREQAAAHTIDFYCASQRARGAQADRLDLRKFTDPGNGERSYRACRKNAENRVRTVTEQGGVSGYMSLFATPRMSAIFVARPAYPAFLVPFIAALGITWGLWAAAVAVTVAASALVVAVLRTLGTGVPVALAGQVLYYALPIGAQSMRPMTEGLMLVGVLTVVLGCVGLLHRPEHSWRWVGAAAAGFALAALAKYSQTLLLAGCLALALLGVAAARRSRGCPVPRNLTLLLGLCAGAAVLVQTGIGVLHLPSTRDSMQDLLAFHFSRPDVADPWHRFLLLSRNFWTEWLRDQCVEPLTVALLATGVWGVLRRGRALAAVVLAVGIAGLINQAGHPDVSVGPRLMVLVWVLPVVGLPLLWSGRAPWQAPGGVVARQSPVQQPEPAVSAAGKGV